MAALALAGRHRVAHTSRAVISIFMPGASDSFVACGYRRLLLFVQPPRIAIDPRAERDNNNNSDAAAAECLPRKDGRAIKAIIISIIIIIISRVSNNATGSATWRPFRAAAAGESCPIREATCASAQVGSGRGQGRGCRATTRQSIGHVDAAHRS